MKKLTAPLRWRYRCIQTSWYERHSYIRVLFVDGASLFGVSERSLQKLKTAQVRAAPSLVMSPGRISQFPAQSDRNSHPCGGRVR
jgi:hypothetical protein